MSDIRVFSADDLDRLVDEAAAAPRKRQHRTLHARHEEPCQRLFIAIGLDSYVRPHRHALVPRTETLLAVRGRLALIELDAEGRIGRSVVFGAGCGDAAALPCGVEIPAGPWHTLLALTPGAILFETKAGPFDPSRPKELAPWAPEEGSAEAPLYLAALRREVLARGGAR